MANATKVAPKLVTIIILAVFGVVVHDAAGAPPLYDVTPMGLTDADHTASDGTNSSWDTRLNASGHVAGASGLHVGKDWAGESTWIYDGITTTRIGLIDAAHTGILGSEDYDYQYSTIEGGNDNNGLNAAGQVTGYSMIYDPSTGEDIGRSTWLYNGTSTVRIGLTDAEHNGTGGLHTSYPRGLNDAGDVIGTSNRFDGATQIGMSGWFYDGTSTTRLGYTDADHTNSSNQRQQTQVSSLNASGQVTGYSYRYDSGNNAGQSAWLYDGSHTRLGYITGDFVGPNNNQSSEIRGFNDAGQVIGVSYRYDGASALGAAAWLYDDGSGHTQLGYIDAGHTNSSTGYKQSYANELNASGEVMGFSERFDGSTDMGRTAWIYDGVSHVEVGLIGGVHEASNGKRENYGHDLNDAGHAVGEATRYNGTSDIGRSAWLYDGTTTEQIGLTDATHTRTGDGYQQNGFESLNASGQVAGYAQRYDGSGGYAGTSGWFYDPATDTTTSLVFSVRPSDGYARTEIDYLTDDGVVLGKYREYAGETYLGDNLFMWSIADGMHHLEDLVQGGIAASGWDTLLGEEEGNGVEAMNVLDQILGASGLRNDAGGSEMSFLMNVVPEPATLSFMALGGLAILRRRRVTT